MRGVEERMLLHGLRRRGRLDAVAGLIAQDQLDTEFALRVHPSSSRLACGAVPVGTDSPT
nr:hypothetical protein GCM10025699_15150 [Microbacterium flavescens]